MSQVMTPHKIKQHDTPSAKILSEFLDKFKFVINSLIAMLANIISKTD